MTVPTNWECQGFGRPQYTNFVYPFPGKRGGHVGAGDGDGLAWRLCSMAWHGMAWHGTALRGLVRHGMMSSVFSRQGVACHVHHGMALGPWLPLLGPCWLASCHAVSCLPLPCFS